MAEEKKQKERTILKKRVGQEIQVVFLDANVMKGVLKKVTYYELILEVGNEDKKEEVIVFKHAVKYIR